MIMASEYKLSYTAQEIDEKLGKIDQLLESSLPEVSAEDNGKLLQVVGGSWAAVVLPNAEAASF